MNQFNIWLLGYGTCSITAGAASIWLFLKLSNDSRWILGGLGLYMLISGIAIVFHHRRSPALFLTTGLLLLGLSLFGMFIDGYGRSQHFLVLGSLITVHGYWVLKQQVEKDKIE